MKIAIGNDHAATELKFTIMEYVKSLGHEVINFGTDSNESCNYPEYGEKVGRAVVNGEADCGILICGTGVGISIAANKVKGAYAALLSDIYSAKRARLSNDANIACMGAFTIGNKLREELTDAFLTNEFVPGCSSQPKVDAFREYEAAHQK